MSIIPKSRCVLAALLILSSALTHAEAPPSEVNVSQPSTPTRDFFTPVTASLVGVPPKPFLGSDGQVHVVYELMLTNAKPAEATLLQIDVFDAALESRILASYKGPGLLGRLRTLQPRPAASASIEFNASRLFYIELSFKPEEVPKSIAHRMRVLGAANPAPKTPATSLDYRLARVTLDAAALPVLSSPLQGDNWVVMNGCCNSDIVHRGSFQTVNGGLFDAQRFAIDYMRLNRDGEFVHGDSSKAENFVGYGSKVLAVANGTVVGVLDGLDDQAPGTLPDPSTITLETVDGNHVILDIGEGYHVLYAHLKKGSIRVRVGDKLTPGMVIAELGNSGNTSAPHLHLHVMNSPSVLGSSGLPYLVDAFQLRGQVDAKAFADADTLDGRWGTPLDHALTLKQRFPMNLNIVDFP